MAKRAWGEEANTIKLSALREIHNGTLDAACYEDAILGIEAGLVGLDVVPDDETSPAFYLTDKGRAALARAS
jgi:hypothetical protein